MVDLICPIVSTTREGEDRKVIDYVVSGGRGANIIFILGQTGEFSSIDYPLKLEKIESARKEICRQRCAHSLARRDLKLAVGITGKDMDETIKLAQYAEGFGADYLVFMPMMPTHDLKGRLTQKPSENIDTLLGHSRFNIPIILYNNPELTLRKNMGVDIFERFAKNSRIAAIKDSSGDLERLKSYRGAAQGNAKVYAGNEILGLKSPGDGIVAGSANILPAAWGRAVRTDWGEDVLAGKVQAELAEFQKEYSKNPIGAFQYILEKMGVIGFTSPYDPNNVPSPSLTKRLDKLIEQDSFQVMFEAAKQPFNQ
jgi:4-hydroxy-tetrahydrodipicolinate synthase